MCVGIVEVDLISRAALWNSDESLFGNPSSPGDLLFGMWFRALVSSSWVISAFKLSAISFDSVGKFSLFKKVILCRQFVQHDNWGRMRRERWWPCPWLSSCNCCSWVCSSICTWSAPNWCLFTSACSWCITTISPSAITGWRCCGSFILCASTPSHVGWKCSFFRATVVQLRKYQAHSSGFKPLFFIAQTTSDNAKKGTERGLCISSYVLSCSSSVCSVHLHCIYVWYELKNKDLLWSSGDTAFFWDSLQQIYHTGRELGFDSLSLKCCTLLLSCHFIIILICMHADIKGPILW